jgi:hypothetical protein
VPNYRFRNTDEVGEAYAFLPVPGGRWLISHAHLRAFRFPLVTPGEVASDLAIVETAAKLEEYERGVGVTATPEEVDAIADGYCSGWSGGFFSPGQGWSRAASTLRARRRGWHYQGVSERRVNLDDTDDTPPLSADARLLLRALSWYERDTDTLPAYTTTSIGEIPLRTLARSAGLTVERTKEVARELVGRREGIALDGDSLVLRG